MRVAFIAVTDFDAGEMKRWLIWLGLLVAAALSIAVVIAFHSGKELPADEPWFTATALLPTISATWLFSRWKSISALYWLLLPMLAHDAIWLAAVLGAETTGMQAVYWRATHSMAIVFVFVPTLVTQIWVRRRAALRNDT